jgi:hypothetical protein
LEAAERAVEASLRGLSRRLVKRHGSMIVMMRFRSALVAVFLASLSIAFYLSRAGNTSHVTLDEDDSTFFKTSRKLSELGDHEFALANAALDKKKFQYALRFSKHAEKAFKNAMHYGKYREAKKLSETLEATIKARSDAEKLQMSMSVAKAERMKERALANQALQSKLADETEMQNVIAKAQQVRGVWTC